MKKKIFLAAICMVFISASICQALPTYTITSGPHRAAGFEGGPFNISGSGYNLDTFCLETGEFLSLGSTYPGTIDEAVALGTSQHNTHFTTLATNTINLYGYYLDHEGSLNTTQVTQIQEAIWAFQQQVIAGDSLYPGATNDYFNNPSAYFSPTVRDIDALNLWASQTCSHTDPLCAKQSLLIVEQTSVPEPGILILLGLGLVGLAGTRKFF